MRVRWYFETSILKLQRRRSMRGFAPHISASLYFQKLHISKYQRTFKYFTWNWIYSKISGKLAINYQFQINKHVPNNFKICSGRLNVEHNNSKTEKSCQFWRSKNREDNSDTRYAYPRISHWPLSFWIPKTLPHFSVFVLSYPEQRLRLLVSFAK